MKGSPTYYHRLPSPSHTIPPYRGSSTALSYSRYSSLSKPTTFLSNHLLSSGKIITTGMSAQRRGRSDLVQSGPAAVPKAAATGKQTTTCLSSKRLQKRHLSIPFSPCISPILSIVLVIRPNQSSFEVIVESNQRIRIDIIFILYRTTKQQKQKDDPTSLCPSIRYSW